VLLLLFFVNFLGFVVGVCLPVGAGGCEEKAVSSAETSDLRRRRRGRRGRRRRKRRRR